jgi:hypothetical protein
MHRHLIPKFVGVVVLLTALGGGAAYAFTASNTVAPTFAGEGSGTVSGYAVSNISYTGLGAGGANLGGSFPLSGPIAQGNTGTPEWLGAPVVNGLAQQDGVTTVSFTLSPDNATWAAVQLYNAGGVVIGGGGASNCGETSGVWTCNVYATAAECSADGLTCPTAVPMVDIAYLDVEAAQ